MKANRSNKFKRMGEGTKWKRNKKGAALQNTSNRWLSIDPYRAGRKRAIVSNNHALASDYRYFHTTCKEPSSPSFACDVPLYKIWRWYTEIHPFSFVDWEQYGRFVMELRYGDIGMGWKFITTQWGSSLIVAARLILIMLKSSVPTTCKNTLRLHNWLMLFARNTWNN